MYHWCIVLVFFMYYGYTLLMYSPHIIDVLLMQSRCINDALLMCYWYIVYIHYWWSVDLVVMYYECIWGWRTSCSWCKNNDTWPRHDWLDDLNIENFDGLLEHRWTHVGTIVLGQAWWSEIISWSKHFIRHNWIFDSDALLR